MDRNRWVTLRLRLLLVLVPAAAGALGAPTLEAQITTTCTGTLGDWSDPTNWDNGLPTLSDTASISNGGIANITSAGGICDTLILSPGTVALSGTGQLSAGSEYSGYSGTGIFIQSGGTNSVSSGLNLGWYSGGSGTYNLSGSGQLSAAVENIGFPWGGGTGTFIQSGGTNTISYRLSIGWNYGANGTYSLSGGLLSAPEECIGWWWGTGIFGQSGGTNAVSNGLSIGWGDGGGTYNLNGGLLLTRALVGSTAHFNFGGGTLQATDDFNTTVPMTINPGGAFVDTNGFNVTFSTNVAGSDGLTKLGDGKLILTGSNTYSGPTNVNAGTLLVDGTHSRGGLYTVANSATLGGNGSIHANVVVGAGGTLAPGDALANLDIQGSVDLEGILKIAVTDDANDRLTGLHALTLGPSSVLDIEASGSAFAGATYTIADYQALFDTFATIDNLPSNYRIDYGSGFNSSITLVPVPEPSTLALLATGAIGLLAFAWRRKPAI